MDTIAALERYRHEFFSRYSAICVDDLRPGMRVVVPDDPNDYGGGDLFVEVTRLNVLSNLQTSIVGKLTRAHPTVGDVGSDVVAVSPFEQVGRQ